MKIYLFLENKIVDFSLPKIVEGSYSFDENPMEEIKLINIDSKDSKWILYSTPGVTIMDNGSIIGTAELKMNTFYVLQRNDINYLIYVIDYYSNRFQLFSYNTSINLIIGNKDDSNLKYSCPYLKDLSLTIRYENDKLCAFVNGKGVYYNGISTKSDSFVINNCDEINIYGLKIYFLNNLIAMNNPGGEVILLPSTNINKITLDKDEDNLNIEVKDKNLIPKKLNQ